MAGSAPGGHARRRLRHEGSGCDSPADVDPLRLHRSHPPSNCVCWHREGLPLVPTLTPLSAGSVLRELGERYRRPTAMRLRLLLLAAFAAGACGGGDRAPVAEASSSAAGSARVTTCIADTISDLRSEPASESAESALLSAFPASKAWDFTRLDSESHVRFLVYRGEELDGYVDVRSKEGRWGVGSAASCVNGSVVRESVAAER